MRKSVNRVWHASRLCLVALGLLAVVFPTATLAAGKRSDKTGRSSRVASGTSNKGSHHRTATRGRSSRGSVQRAGNRRTVVRGQKSRPSSSLGKSRGGAPRASARPASRLGRSASRQGRLAGPRRGASALGNSVRRSVKPARRVTAGFSSVRVSSARSATIGTGSKKSRGSARSGRRSRAGSQRATAPSATRRSSASRVPRSGANRSSRATVKPGVGRTGHGRQSIAVGRSRGDRDTGFVRLGRGTIHRDRDHGRVRQADFVGRYHGRSSYGRRNHHHDDHGNHGYYYHSYPYFSSFPYYGLLSFGYFPGYSFGFHAGYRYGYDPWYDYSYYPWYGYGSAASYSTQIFDVDIYELDRSVDYVSVGEPATSVASRQADFVGSEIAGDPSDDAVDRALAEGQTAMVAGQFDRARHLFSQAMFLDDRDGRAKLLFALASLGEGEIDLAGLALRRALLTTPELIDNPWDLRTVFPSSEAGLPDEQAFQRQLDELEHYLSDFKEHRGARLLLGYLHFGWGDAHRAHAMFSELALSDPQDTLAIRLRDSAARIISQAGK